MVTGRMGGGGQRGLLCPFRYLNGSSPSFIKVADYYLPKTAFRSRCLTEEISWQECSLSLLNTALEVLDIVVRKEKEKKEKEKK